MAQVSIKLRGATAYVPHSEGDALLAVLPNATHLGMSPKTALDGTPLARHWPIFWVRTFYEDGRESLTGPNHFLGSRLSFTVNEENTPTGADLSELEEIWDAVWLEINRSSTSRQPDHRISGQVLIDTGSVSVTQPSRILGPCRKAWSRAGLTWSLDPVILGLTVEIDEVERIELRAVPFIDVRPDDPLLAQDLEGVSRVDIEVGNVCAEDYLDWTGNAFGRRTPDSDFKWLFQLSTSDYIAGLLACGDKLPVPVVSGSTIAPYALPFAAFEQIWGGGGGVGCECEGVIDAPRAFEK